MSSRASTVALRRLRKLVMDVPEYGADVQVLEPAALRKRVGEALRKAAQRYK